MNTNARVSRMYSPEFQELQSFFRSVSAPYGQRDILRFNEIYGRIYKQLSCEEKMRAEGFVDSLIEGAAHYELVSRIFGVV